MIRGTVGEFTKSGFVNSMQTILLIIENDDHKADRDHKADQ